MFARILGGWYVGFKIIKRLTEARHAIGPSGTDGTGQPGRTGRTAVGTAAGVRYRHADCRALTVEQRRWSQRGSMAIIPLVTRLQCHASQ